VQLLAVARCRRAVAGPKQHWGTAFDSVASPIYALGEDDPNYEADEARASPWA